jgi:hypothetical protein
MAFSQIQIRRDTTVNWTSNNPVLADGEVAIDTTSKRIKVGDGSTAWTYLGFANDSESIILYLSPLNLDAVANTKVAIINSLPYNLQVNELIVALEVAPVGSDYIVDINVGGVSFLSGKLTVPSGQLVSTSYTIDTTTFINSRIPKGSLVTVDIDQHGSTTAGRNPILIINGVRY